MKILKMFENFEILNLILTYFRMQNQTENSLWDIGEEELLMITWIFEGILLPIIGVVGIVGNAISLVVIHKVSFKKTW